MKKIILLIFVFFILTGCETDEVAFKRGLDEAIESVLSAKTIDPSDNNCTKSYYSYNANNNIGRIEASNLSNEFVINGNKCSLSLDSNSIVQNQIYSDSKDFVLRNIEEIENPYYVKSGTFINSSQQTIAYKITIVNLGNNHYFVLIQTSQFIFVAFIDNGNCENTIMEMLTLLRSCKVDTTSVIVDNASQSVVQYETNVVSLFQEVMPESGYIADYIEDYRKDTTFVVIDRNRPAVDENQLQQMQEETNGEIQEVD